MATTITKTVKSSGGDYTSLSAFEAAIPASIVATDEIWKAVCYAFEDTTPCTIDGVTTDATRYIQVTVAPGHRHSGVWTTAAYRLNVNTTFSKPLNVFIPNVRLEWLQVRQNNATADAYCGATFIDADGCKIEQCIIIGSGTSASDSDGSGLQWTSSGSLTVRNCVVYGQPRLGLNLDVFAAGNGLFENCVFIGGTNYGCNANDGGDGSSCLIKNCYVHGPTNAYNGIAAGVTLVTCAHSSATSFTGSTPSIAHSTGNFVNVTSGSQNYHLASGSGLIDIGTDLSASFTIDIDGGTRPTGASTWDIGADEFGVDSTPATITKTLKTSGGDYTTIAAFESAQQGDLGTANEVRQLECYAFQSTDTDAVVIDGSTTSPLHYMRIYAAAGQGHGGLPGAGYRMQAGVGLDLADDYVRIEGISINRNDAATGTQAGIYVRNTGCVISGNLIANWCTSSGRGIMIDSATPGVSYIYNNVVYAVSISSGGRGIFTDSTTCTCYWYNNTVAIVRGALTGTGIMRTATATVILKNNLVVANVAYSGTFDASSTNNVAARHTSNPAQGLNQYNNGCVIFEDEANNNFKLSWQDASAARQGADLSADAALPFNVDIAGVTRTAPWDIGAFFSNSSSRRLMKTSSFPKTRLRRAA